jgi:transposase InsO family protein
VIGVLQYLFAIRGVPEHIRSDNGPEFVAKDIRRWLVQAGVSTLFIAKSSPWENGYVESFNGKFRDELLNGELFLGLADARWVIDRWRLDYNHRRPHSALDHHSPAAFAASSVFWRIPLRFIHQNTEPPLTRNSLIRSGTRSGG